MRFSGTIPESLFVIFQMTFAIITVAIISGSIADRMKYSAFMAFIAVWVILVYAPITHWCGQRMAGYSKQAHWTLLVVL